MDGVGENTLTRVYRTRVSVHADARLGYTCSFFVLMSRHCRSAPLESILTRLINARLPSQPLPHRPHVCWHLSLTLRLMHLPLRSFFAHLRAAHLPGASTHGPLAASHSVKSLGHDPWTGLQTPVECLTQTACSVELSPSTNAVQPHTTATGGGGE